MSTSMIGRRSEIGYEARLRPRGVGRYFSAAFLATWLCGWIVGEAFALWLLVRGGLALITGQPLVAGEEPIHLATAVAVGVFLIVWLSLWTIGGVAAITELLRELWGEDRLVAAPDAVLVEWRAGPFRRLRAIPRGEIIDIALLPRRGWLVVDTVRERIEAGRLGSESERREVAAALRRQLGLGEGAKPVSPALPEEWAEVTTPESQVVLAPSPATRVLQTRVAAIFAIAALGITAVFMRAAVRDPAWWPGALIAAAASIALGVGVGWLALGRNEWRIESGSLVLQRRFRDRVTERFCATRLALTQSEDSDGDDWFELAAESDATATAGVISVSSTSQRKERRRIVRRMNDDATPRRLGLWLAQRAGIPLDDRTTALAREAEIAALRAKLEASGRWGRFVNRLINRLEKRVAR